MSRYKRDKTLEPFTALYYQLQRDITSALEGLTTGELNEVIQAARNTTQTNCDWATYAIAPKVADAAYDLKERREMEREARVESNL